MQINIPTDKLSELGAPVVRRIRNLGHMPHHTIYWLVAIVVLLIAGIWQ